MNDHISITIDYKLAKSGVCGRLQLTAEEYFEPIDIYVDFNADGTMSELTEDELLELSEHDIDSIPMYLHAWEYLPLSSCQVEHTKLSICDKKENSSLIQSETFWEEGKNRIISRKVVRPNNSYREVIVETLINKTTMQSVKMQIKDEVPKLHTHWIIQRDENGRERLISNKSPESEQQLNPFIKHEIESRSRSLRVHLPSERRVSDASQGDIKAKTKPPVEFHPQFL